MKVKVSVSFGFLQLSVLLCLLSVVSVVAFATPDASNTVTDASTVLPIVHQKGYFVDQSGKLTAVQGAALPATKFTSMGPTTEFGPTEHALWVRLIIENPLNKNLSKILDTANFVVARAALYRVNSDGSVTLLYDKSGHNTSVLLQNDRRFAVPIELAQKAVETLLIGYQSDFYTHLHLQFKSQDDYLSDYRLQMAASIAIVDILALLCFINLLFFFALRERFHLYYSLQQLVTIMLVLSEVGLLGGDFHFAGGQTRAGGLLPLVVMGLALIFTADFLNLKSTMPKVNRLFMGLAGFFFAALPFGFWGVGYYPFFTHVIPVLISFSILIPVIFAVRLFYRGLTYVVPFIGGGIMLALCVFPYLAAQVDVVGLEEFPH